MNIAIWAYQEGNASYPSTLSCHSSLGSRNFIKLVSIKVAVLC
ncbi:hypothetical protein [Wolbachia endosymbiont of Nomada panzeri]|nr:hypothetical protein [Wolbachia endosymbiont of Nomada panzeri]